MKKGTGSFTDVWCRYRLSVPFISHNYVFYRIEDECICIVNLYHEREDFMWKLFGIETVQQETLDYWNE